MTYYQDQKEGLKGAIHWKFIKLFAIVFLLLLILFGLGWAIIGVIALLVINGMAS